MRRSGILLPVSSIPGKYGIGSFSKESYEFVDFLKKAGQKLWQILPLGPTGYGDSPYQSFSTFAGNPYFIDLEEFIQKGLLTEEECNAFSYGNNEECVNYAEVYNSRKVLLKKAYERSNMKEDEEFQKFVNENEFWLNDYALYMAVKDDLGGSNWTSWNADIKIRKPESLASYREKLQAEIECYQFQQYYFQKQWLKLKKYANDNGIEIIGDIPLYVAMDSCDVWVHSDVFELDEDLRQINIAGVPPDLFSATGQRWGNPLYRWDVMEENGFDWWKQRMLFSSYHYDVIRIDHFIGIVNYYSIPAECETAIDGEWKKGPGKKLTDMINSTIGSGRIIAEDLGVLTQPVIDLIEENNYPGMKILGFALDLTPDNVYLPHNYTHDNSIIYIGTHDNETLVGALSNIDEARQWRITEYYDAQNPYDIPRAIIKRVYSTNCRVAIFQMQDLLYLDNSARLNAPSSVGENWRWRLLEEQYEKIDTKYYKHLAEIYYRINTKEQQEEKEQKEKKLQKEEKVEKVIKAEEKK